MERTLLAGGVPGARARGQIVLFDRVKFPQGNFGRIDRAANPCSLQTRTEKCVQSAIELAVDGWAGACGFLQASPSNRTVQSSKAGF